MTGGLKAIWEFMMFFLDQINTFTTGLMQERVLIEAQTLEEWQYYLYVYLTGEQPTIGVTTWENLSLTGLEILVYVLIAAATMSLLTKPVKVILEAFSFA